MRSGSRLWNDNHRLVLASKSASRRALLESASIPFLTVTADVDERRIERGFLSEGGPPEKLATTLARAKALEVSRRQPGALCLGADQVLSLGDIIFHKARSLADAGESLSELSGRTHRLTSAFAIALDGDILHEADDVAELSMRALEPSQIALYLECAGPDVLSSVGCYQLEATGIHLFEAIRGEHSTILGLPLLKLLAWLRSYGAILL